MAKKGHKAIKVIILIFILLIIGGFALNWFLTYRLESRLNRILSEEISQATDGFYNFSFDKLKIGFFSGELSIKGVNLAPDSLVYSQWEKGDSLPDTYYDVSIGEIHFKGINLTWIWDYRNLNFSLFEVNSPDIKIYNTNNPNIKDENKTENKELKDLYEIVSPYISTLTVSRINLADANISYTIKDSISPVIYALKDANFRAYNFRLDKNSFVSGKLLYSDNFEFKADSPQVLLYSDQFILNTDNIKLSTIESLIRIEGVQISPIESQWNMRLIKEGDYLKTEIKSVEVKGVKFNREEAKNYLTADSFNIATTDISYYNVKKNNIDSIKVEKNANDTLPPRTAPWSLYSIISPILNSIRISKIGIEKTKFNYTLTQDRGTDIYTMEEFDFHANNFLVDSLSEKEKKFWYVDNFALIGTHINGEMQSNNANISVAELLLDTEKKKFSISDITIEPLSLNATSDYISGKLKSITVDGLDYNTGVSASQLLIESPLLNYFRVEQKERPKRVNEQIKIRENIVDFFTPYADYLSVDNINLSNADITVRYNNSPEVYHIEDLNFYATKFLVDDETRKKSRYLFTFDDVGLSFRNFDNNIPGSNHRLKVDAVNISSLTSKARFENIQMIPKADTLLDMSYNLHIPLLELTGLNHKEYLANKSIAIKSIILDSPNISVEKGEKTKEPETRQITEMPNLSGIFSMLKIDTIALSHANILYKDKINGDSLRLTFNNLGIGNLNLLPDDNFNIDNIGLVSPQIVYFAEKNNGKSSSPQGGANHSIAESFQGLSKKIKVNNFFVSDLNLKMDQPESKIHTTMPWFSFRGWNWDFRTKRILMSFREIEVQEPLFNIDLAHHHTESEESVKKDNRSKDLYTLLAQYTDTLYIGGVDISNANIDYKNTSQGHDTIEQKINSTYLFLKDIAVNTRDKKVDFSDFKFATKDIYFPIMDGFYTIGIDAINLDKKERLVALDNVRMISTYPKEQFAYIHLKHKDWFDVTTRKIVLTGVNYDTYFSDNTLKAKKLVVENVLLQNFKNQKIEIQHNIMPLIYEKIQNLPIKLFIDSANISDFTVIYEELPKKGNNPGVIRFDHMNGKITNLTNVAYYPDQYMRLHVDGIFMEEGYFTAIWDIPVSKDYDCFVLEARLLDFDLKALNKIFTPLASAELKRGRLNDFSFITEASSKDAYARMLFRYDSINVWLLKDKETKEPNMMMSNIVNTLISTRNPGRGRKNPREANIYIERDPYHSTFNYFWQILQPALAESAGISQREQKLAKRAAGFFGKVKNFFSGKKEEKEGDKK
ncbi:MAG: hypothetical protein LBV43_05585 [Prevotella sp.]|jgi:hypothetical protein|nr:hypothetical protein [Prevotella sp.]